jgi:poly-beta-hydroxyalkanoate depolymerase
VFNGSRFRNEIAPRIVKFIAGVDEANRRRKGNGAGGPAH